jgi:hypothetical protein
MPVSADPPDPPTLETVDPNQYEDATVESDDYHRDDLEAFLREGAWREAFAEWAPKAGMDDGEFAIAVDLDLFAEFDFFWDDFADRVGYHAPGIPEDWKERGYHPDIDSWGTVSAINAGLTEFGQTVCEVLKDEYVDWEAAYEPPEDLPDF